MVGSWERNMFGNIEGLVYMAFQDTNKSPLFFVKLLHKKKATTAATILSERYVTHQSENYISSIR